ncbi:orotidine-5'-phosphate decarboxylase [Candidatus Omnitrophota bacterium]
MEAKEKLIVALDVDSPQRALEMIEILSPEVEAFKVGITPFTDFGQCVLDKLQSAGKKVFLDLKFHDIPNTAAGAARAAAKKGVFMMNFHCLGGRRMLEEGVRGAKEGASGAGCKPPILLGVTILTSMSEEDMCAIGITGNIQSKVLELARVARDAGMDGVVASAKEARAIKEKIGKDFLIVTPGIRPEWAASGDQKRVLTPRQAISEGADYIVVGRPIIQAEDPLQAARRIIEELRI